MSKHLLALAAMALAVPAFSAAALEGAGTAESPYQIATVDDLKEIATIDQSDYSYYILMADIDMTGEAWQPLFTDAKDVKVGKLHFDGNCHVISNLTSTVAYASLFGQVDGSVKNLGLRDLSCVAGGKWDPAGAIAAYAGNNDTFTAEGCFVTGTVGGYYGGGMIGGTKVGATLTNCYTDVVVTNASTFAGGLCGAVNYRKISDEEGLDNTLNVDNCFVVNNVSGATVGGILGTNQTYLHAATGSEILNVTNAVIMSELITGTGGAGAIAFTGGTPALVVNEENVKISDMTKVNGVAVEGGYSFEDLVEEITTWPAFVFNEETYMPCLRWEVEGAAGISDIVVDSADAPAVYYNLQGVQIANPENGIYIVRRGNKATKQLVK